MRQDSEQPQMQQSELKRSLETETQDNRLRAKRAKYSFGDEVEILVGSKEDRFVVHRAILTARSSFFKAACSDTWNSNNEALKLPEDEPKIFQLYLEYVYETSNAGIIEGSSDNMADRTKIYVLADKLGDIKSMNAIIDDFLLDSDLYKDLPSERSVRVAFKQTTESSPLRRLLVDYYVHEAHRTSWNKELLKMPRAFLEAVLMQQRLLQDEYRDATIRETFKLKVSERVDCYYHKHDETCPSRKCLKSRLTQAFERQEKAKAEEEEGKEEEEDESEEDGEEEEEATE